MTVANNFLPLGTGVGANVEAQATYASDAQLGQGQQPGVARSAFNNKALRQATSIASQLAQYIANTNNSDVLDNMDTAPAQLLSCLTAALSILPPITTVYTSGTQTFSPTYYVYSASASATAGAVYKDGSSNSFTVPTTFSTATVFQLQGATPPALGTGALTLTKFSGTGDSTITYYATRVPIKVNVKCCGGGSGGGSAGTPSVAPTGGGTTTIDSIITCTGATATGSSSGASPGSSGAPGTATVTTSSTVVQRVAITGGRAQSGLTPNSEPSCGSIGGSTPFAGAGAAQVDSAGTNASANTGSGGGGGGFSNVAGAAGGSAGGYADVDLFGSAITNLTVTIGTGGTGGTGSVGGGNGGGGIAIFDQQYQ